jgi:hypothetical protein
MGVLPWESTSFFLPSETPGFEKKIERTSSRFAIGSPLA